jgi:sugar lactone lactonase YvrE
LVPIVPICTRTAQCPSRSGFDVSDGTVLTVTGNGRDRGYNGDDIPPASAWLNLPAGVALDARGDIYIADAGNFRVREIGNNRINTVAGDGSPTYNGDNIPAATSQLDRPADVAVDLQGNVFVADTYNQPIRKVSNGIVTTIAGDGQLGVCGDGLSATSAQLSYPAGVATDGNGNVYIADTKSSIIREVSNGIITTIAGNYIHGYNGPATAAEVNEPQGIAVDSHGNAYIADSGNRRIRKVSNGTISTIAGSGVAG